MPASATQDFQSASDGIAISKEELATLQPQSCICGSQKEKWKVKLFLHW